MPKQPKEQRLEIFEIFSERGFTAFEGIRIVRTTTTDSVVIVEKRRDVKHHEASTICPDGEIGRHAS
ncbi:hypothetical protein, partial [Pseudomonas qingdaonensis]|uniref:hypothetical protein n=1 Tax=Pseudomonas qingdaonensis TaxID=2056231 RepID=UPI003CFE598D